MFPSIRVQSDWRQSKPGECFWINLTPPGKPTIFADATLGANNQIKVTDSVLAEVVESRGAGKLLKVKAPEGQTLLSQGPGLLDSRGKGKAIDSIDVLGSLMLRSHRGGEVGVYELAELGAGKPPSRNLSNVHAGDVYVTKFFPSGTVALTAGADATLRIFDLADFTEGEADAMLGGHKAGVTGADFVGRGRNVVSCSRDGTAKLWDVSTQQAIHSWNLKSEGNGITGAFAHPIATTGAAQDPREVGTDGRLLAVACEGSLAQLFDLRSRDMVMSVSTTRACNAVGILGDTIYAGSQDGGLMWVDFRTRQLLGYSNRDESPIVHLSPFNDKLILVVHTDGAAYLWNGEKTASVDFESPDTESLLSACVSGTTVFTGGKEGICRGYQVDLATLL